MVGSVIVHKNKIIGEGWHQTYGGPHAEVNAIKAVKDSSLLSKSIIYVSLEPCSHFGKTPPCSDLIIASGIKKIVIGTVDPFEKVAGKGVKKLLDAGCEVLVGLLEKECWDLNKRFFTFHHKKRPYIILKWAQTEDGFIAPEFQEDRNPVWITNKYSKQLVHKWRSEEQAILIGTNTAVKDNPKLNTRLWKGKDPTRIVIDRNLRIPGNSALFDSTVKTIVICENCDPDRVNNSDNLIFEPINFSEEIATQICEVLHRHEIQSVIVEGGSKTLQTFIDAGLWDETRIFTGNKKFRNGIKSPEFTGNLSFEQQVEDDNLKIHAND